MAGFLKGIDLSRTYTPRLVSKCFIENLFYVSQDYLLTYRQLTGNGQILNKDCTFLCAQSICWGSVSAITTPN